MTQIRRGRSTINPPALRIASLAVLGFTALAPIDIANAQHGGGGHGGGGGGFHGGDGGARGGGGDRRGYGGYGGYGDWNGGFYDAHALIYGSPGYCSPALVYRHGRQYQDCF